MSIPLVRNNTKDAINTSIIAIKKNLERINSLLGLADSSEPDLSGLATKQELEDAVSEINDTIDEVETSLQPVDAVASGNMHSVTSDTIFKLRRGLFYDTGLLELTDNQEKTVKLDAGRMYLFVNIHAKSGQELVILNCYNGVLKQTRITHSYNGYDTVITNSGQNVTFKSTGGCRGHLLYLTDYTST